MKYLVWDLAAPFSPLVCNQLRLYEEDKHDGTGGVLILGGSFDESEEQTPTLFDSPEEAEEAVERTNNWFFDDCGDPEMFRCAIIEVSSSACTEEKR